MAVSKINNSVRTGRVQVPHAAVPNNGYGYIAFTLPPAQEGEQLIALTPMTNDGAIQVSIYYRDEWRIAYHNAYPGIASAGTFEVLYAYAK